MWKHNDCFETWRWDVESWLKMVNCPCQPIRGQGLWFGPIRSRGSRRLTNERTWDDEDAFWMRVNIGVICNRALAHWLQLSVWCSLPAELQTQTNVPALLQGLQSMWWLLHINKHHGHGTFVWRMSRTLTVSGSVHQLDRCSCLTSNWDFREKHCWSYFFCEGRKELIIYQNFDHVLLRFYLVSISWKWRHLSDTLISGSSEMPV